MSRNTKRKTWLSSYCFGTSRLLLALLLCGIIPVSWASLSASSSAGTTTTTTTTSSSTPGATSIFAESALVDKETGRIFWEGGSKSTLSETIESRLEDYGLRKATLVSLVLWGAVYGWLSAWIRHKMQHSVLVQNLQRNTFTAIPLALLKWTLLGVPRVNVWVLLAIVALYLTEAYLSSTHQFLSHRSDCQNVETFIEQLRQQEPRVDWKVRAFHYEPWWQEVVARLPFLNNTTTVISDTPICKNDKSTPSFFLRKRVSHQATKSFANSAGWHDETTAGVWTRAIGETAGPAPLAKIHLTKVIVLSNRQARQAYLEQQARFVTVHDRDALAEFTTSIDVAGYKPRVLVTRIHRRNLQSLLFSRRAFWGCTLGGMSVFYRVWMARHCDVIRVSLVKETALPEKSTFWWSSSSSLSTKTDRNKSGDLPSSNGATTFRHLMQQLEVYRPYSMVALPDGDSNDKVVHPPVMNDTTPETMPAVNITTNEHNETTFMHPDQNKMAERKPVGAMEGSVDTAMSVEYPTKVTVEEDTTSIGNKAHDNTDAIDEVFSLSETNQSQPVELENTEGEKQDESSAAAEKESTDRDIIT